MNAVLTHIDKLEKAAFILKTVAHPARLAIVDMLRKGRKLSVTEISGNVGMEQSLTSHHLNTMKLKGILGCERDGKQVYYYLKEKDVAKVIDCIEHCNCNM
jgi:ArsR family transcriptional regulator